MIRSIAAVACALVFLGLTGAAPPSTSLHEHASTPAGDPPVFVSNDFTLSRRPPLPPHTLQVVVFYDGAHRATLCLEYMNGDEPGWIEIDDIRASTSDRGRINTYEFDLGAARLTGRVEVKGVVANGVVDGLAFGIFWRDADGVHQLKSTAPDEMVIDGADRHVDGRQRRTFVGAWPVGINDRTFARRTPQLSKKCRAQARMMIYGAEYLQNGMYLFTIRERAVRVRGEQFP